MTLYYYVGAPSTPYKQVCIHCKAAEAIKPTLYCQPCLDALGQEWMKNYELGLLHSTLPAFFEAVAMIGAFQIDWHILIAEDALDMHLVHYNAYYKWLMKWRRESEVEA